MRLKWQDIVRRLISLDKTLFFVILHLIVICFLKTTKGEETFMSRLNLRSLEYSLLLVCDRETSQDPDNWTKDNPLWGHCAVVALIVQNNFGGELLRASLEHIPTMAHMRSHYYNRLPDGTVCDLTKRQFGDEYPDLTPEVRDRSYVIGFPETKKRYECLSSRLTELLNWLNRWPE